MNLVNADTFPVCRFVVKNNIAVLEQLIGTCFFINANGVFITAKHVIEDALFYTKKYGGFVGICALLSMTSLQTIAIPIDNYEFAKPPYDVAIGKVNYNCKTTYTIDDSSVAPGRISFWLDVATLGYPASAVSITLNDTIQITNTLTRLRAHKGYIQRLILASDDTSNTHPDSFETSFLISPGLSGAPLFIYNYTNSIVIGICVGCKRHVIGDKIEEYGIAHDIRPLAKWKPACLEGKTLLEISKK